MGSESGQQGPPVGLDALAERLAEEAGSFEFFQAVRLLERLLPDRSRVGDYEDPSTEVARFSAHPSLAFPRGDIHELAPGDDEDAPVRMSVNFMGLVGPNGVLPHHYTLMVAAARRRGDPATGAFLDLFNHRIISLFYRAWCKHRVTVAAEIADDGVDPVARHVVDLLGLGTGAAARWAREAPGRLVPLAGLLAPQQRSAVALERLLEATFDVPAAIEQFVGGWAPLSKRDQCAVGDEDPASQLGVGAVVGDEIWDQ
ncbi:MAG TPA: type VI secretion system baseplate subunit TssG, partial [Longimicrobiales bacterium]|nr:type VI secretion system baseplate subunit TssG [Longimicrobiales bacterium]